VAGVPSDPAAGYRVVSDQSYGPPPHQELDIYLPREASRSSGRPALLWLHGGAWVWSSRTSIVLAAPDVFQLADHLGAVVIAVDFRPVPSSPLVEPWSARRAVRLSGIALGKVPIAEQVDDVALAIDWIRTRSAWLGIDPDRLVLLGDSSGAHLATLTAYAGRSWRCSGPPLGWNGQGAPGIRAVVTTSLPSDLAALAAVPLDIFELTIRSLVEHATGCALRSCPERLLDALDPARWVGPDSPPTWLVAGQDDSLTPPFHSERVQDAFSDAAPPGAAELDVVDSGPLPWRTHGEVEHGMNLAALCAWLDVQLA
jgi:acetyl esterase/lipase